VGRPLVKELAVLALHDLEAPAKVGRDPTCHIPQAFWRQSPVIPEAAIDGNGITVAKVFDDHVEHGSVVGFE
jgi:hypothetical protein